MKILLQNNLKRKNPYKIGLVYKKLFIKTPSSNKYACRSSQEDEVEIDLDDYDSKD